jgi:hypothetical protein
MENQIYALLFGNNPDISLDERARILNELQKIGSLTFNISKDEGGWVAQCEEIRGIIAGDTNPNPNNSEIESQIRDAIFSAFNVGDKKEVGEGSDFKRSPFFTYNDFIPHPQENSNVNSRVK